MLTRQTLVIIALGAACGAAAAADLPARKPGLWEITTIRNNPKIPRQVEKICVDAAVDQLLYTAGVEASQKLCSKVNVHTTGGQVIVDSECKMGKSKISSHSVTTLTSQTAYHSDLALHYEPALFGKSDAGSAQEAKWIGACPADMKPGDVVVEPSAMMPVPMRMNLNDMFKGGR